MTLYTRKGDDGTTGLFGTKARFTKGSRVYDALGTLDELNSLLGLCRAHINPDTTSNIARELLQVQQDLFVIQAELAGAPKSISAERLTDLEATINTIEKRIHKTDAFVIPGINTASALFDYVRTISRRAEREVIKAQSERILSSISNAYLNRLSSLLYAHARYAGQKGHLKELTPTY